VDKTVKGKEIKRITTEEFEKIQRIKNGSDEEVGDPDEPDCV
jgi:hypothetical protein